MRIAKPSSLLFPFFSMASATPRGVLVSFVHTHFGMDGVVNATVSDVEKGPFVKGVAEVFGLDQEQLRSMIDEVVRGTAGTATRADADLHALLQYHLEGCGTMDKPALAAGTVSVEPVGTEGEGSQVVQPEQCAPNDGTFETRFGPRRSRLPDCTVRNICTVWRLSMWITNVSLVSLLSIGSSLS